MPPTTQREPVRRLAAGTVVALVAGLISVVAASPAAAASLTVTTADDVVADDGLCSLREAIEAADTDTASGSSTGECAAGSGVDVITFAVPGPIIGGELFCIGSEDCFGTGPRGGAVVIDGGPNGTVIEGTASVSCNPVFVVDGGAHATFESLTIRGGTSCALPYDGTGIEILFGDVVVSRSAIVNNGGVGIGGGWLPGFTGGSLTLVFSTVSDNPGPGLRLGETVDVTVADSTIANNNLGYSSGSQVGGVVIGGGTLHVANSTISGNEGWGIVGSGDVTLEFSTITTNRQGGIYATAEVTASVVAGNRREYDVPYPALTSGGFNVIGTGVGAAAFTAPGDVTGVDDPGLGPLGDNGGPTHTHALLAGSPAIDRVTAAVGSDPAVDQRGITRPQGPAKDAGAFELDEVLLLPGGFGTAEGDSGSQIFEIPISLSRPSTETITVDYVSWPCEIFDGCGDGLATQGVDYADPGTGTLTFLPGETTKTVPVTVYGDLEVEPVYLWGEWFLIRFLDPSPNAVLDSSFFGLGAGVIGSDD